VRTNAILNRAARTAAFCGLLVAALTIPIPGVGAAETADSVVLLPREGTVFSFGGRSYSGAIEVTAHADGLAIVERISLDGYLAGIREVPFSWPDDALRAQAVAARTYLAWTLAAGGSSSGRTYGFDICATDQCQVYAGTGLIAGPDGDRWGDAVSTTAGEILIHEGTPAQALYSSSSGARTRSVEDIWGGSGVPYLVAVDSPELRVTPYPEWRLEMPANVFTRVLAAAGHRFEGSLREVTVAVTEDGSGPWEMALRTWAGERLGLDLVRVRAIFNRYGPQLYPERFPGRRPAGNRWPQTVLSYTFTASLVGAERPVRPDLIPWLPPEDIPAAGSVVIVGTGWGHGVGMSQWGARAMAGTGATYAEILGHYYGGLLPEQAGALLSDEVGVGLAWREARAAVRADGSFEVLADGTSLGSFGPGTWTFFFGDGEVTIVAPARYEGRFGDFWWD
jgi:stage II sporulation protein D